MISKYLLAGYAQIYKNKTQLGRLLALILGEISPVGYGRVKEGRGRGGADQTGEQLGSWCKCAAATCSNSTWVGFFGPEAKCQLHCGCLTVGKNEGNGFKKWSRREPKAAIRLKFISFHLTCLAHSEQWAERIILLSRNLRYLSKQLNINVWGLLIRWLACKYFYLVFKPPLFFN